MKLNYFLPFLRLLTSTQKSYELFCISVSIYGLRCEEEALRKFCASYDPVTAREVAAPLSNLGDADCVCYIAYAIASHFATPKKVVFLVVGCLVMTSLDRSCLCDQNAVNRLSNFIVVQIL